MGFPIALIGSMMRPKNKSQSVEKGAMAMTDANLNLLFQQKRGNWIRLRTLILLRWIAIAGQVIAIFTAIQLYNLQLELALCLLAIGVSIGGNLLAMFSFPETKRLSEFENMMMILFDLLQLSFLLFLTGGLHNPFSILLLAPVAVAANVLKLRSLLILGGTAIALVTILANYHLPLHTDQGFILSIPDIFIFGNWTAIVIALVFLSVYSRRVNNEMNAMGEAVVATQMALAREQKLTDLGGVVAAAAHELGTPLATIKLASSELMEELSDRPELCEDAELIREQADRCRDILQSMGRAGKDDLHLHSAPFSEVIREAAEPHQDRGIDIEMASRSNDMSSLAQPLVLRRPEIIHGLRNMVQNAVDFAHSQVWVETIWSATEVKVRIMDNGPGYPVHVIGRIGDPFMRDRKLENDNAKRPAYEGMGLGLFIAKTLLERTGAELKFANGSMLEIFDDSKGEPTGAYVEISWQRSDIEQANGALGENKQIKA